MFKNILLIGDSLTQLGYSDSGCWVALLADFYQRKCDIINRGFSGYTTRSIKPYVSSLVTENLVKNNAATVIWLGANDSNVKELNEAQHVPLEKYKKKLFVFVHPASIIHRMPKKKMQVSQNLSFLRNN